jgi:phosphatidylglycerol:prolipoprotein diacylglycerol transferase
MFPELNLVLFKISAYSFFTAAALAAVVAGSYLYARKRGFKSADALLMLLGMGLSVFIGARLFNVFVNFGRYVEDPSRIFSLTASGFSLYGGIVLAIPAGLLIARLRKIPLMKFADTVTPFMGIGIALMRIGCFLNGCCFGKETNLSWAVKFPPLSPAHLHQLSENVFAHFEVSPVHPTQIYEFIAALFGTFLAFMILKKKRPDGTAFLLFGIFFSAFRWFNMQFRVLPYSDAIINLWYPLFYAVIIIVGVIFYIHTLKKSGLPLDDSN